MRSSIHKPAHEAAVPDVMGGCDRWFAARRIVSWEPTALRSLASCIACAATITLALSLTRLLPSLPPVPDASSTTVGLARSMSGCPFRRALFCVSNSLACLCQSGASNASDHTQAAAFAAATGQLQTQMCPRVPLLILKQLCRWSELMSALLTHVSRGYQFSLLVTVDALWGHAGCVLYQLPHRSCRVPGSHKGQSASGKRRVVGPGHRQDL